MSLIGYVVEQTFPGSHAVLDWAEGRTEDTVTGKLPSKDEVVLYGSIAAIAVFVAFSAQSAASVFGAEMGHELADEVKEEIL